MAGGDDGGPAFPFKCQGPTTGPEFYYGMSLRDWFAGLVLSAIVSKEGHFASEHFPEDGKSWAPYAAYHLADAMLAERKKNSFDGKEIS